MKKTKLTAESVSKGLGKEVKVEYNSDDEFWIAWIGNPRLICCTGITEEDALRRAVIEYYETYDKSKIYSTDKVIKTSTKFLPNVFGLIRNLIDLAWKFVFVLAISNVVFFIFLILGSLAVIALPWFALQSTPLWFVLLLGIASAICLPLLVAIPFIGYEMLKGSLEKEAERLTFEEVSVPVDEGSLCLSYDKEDGKLSPS